MDELVFIKGENYGLSWLIEGDIVTVDAMFTGDVVEILGTEFGIFTRMVNGVQKKYRVSKAKYTTMQENLKHEGADRW
jgi:lipid-A-disaccharide synthase-like uncharacterized protein